MSDYPITRLVAKWPRLSQAIGLAGLLAMTFCFLAPVGKGIFIASAILIVAIVTVFVLCFVELITLMANTLLPR